MTKDKEQMFLLNMTNKATQEKHRIMSQNFFLQLESALSLLLKNLTTSYQKLDKQQRNSVVNVELLQVLPSMIIDGHFMK